MTTDEILQSLREHHAICEELLALVSKEKMIWQNPEAAASSEVYQAKKNLLPRLQASLDNLKACRVEWQRMAPEERAQNREIGEWLKQTQNLIMKIIVLDRENEQALLRRGFGTPPAKRTPPTRQQPHFVAELYRRNRS
jgi:hypothetical protein